MTKKKRKYVRWYQKAGYLDVIDVDCVADSNIVITATYNNHTIKLTLPEFCKFCTDDLMRMVYRKEFEECK